jgi:hypothetical protein
MHLWFYGGVLTLTRSSLYAPACRDPTITTVVTLLSAYSSYYVADRLVGASGLLAVVCNGFTMSLIGEPRHWVWVITGYKPEKGGAYWGSGQECLATERVVFCMLVHVYPHGSVGLGLGVKCYPLSTWCPVWCVCCRRWSRHHHASGRFHACFLGCAGMGRQHHPVCVVSFSAICLNLS